MLLNGIFEIVKIIEMIKCPFFSEVVFDSYCEI